MKGHKVSIIVPVYNVEKYLERCIDSLIAQTFSDIEIIAVNDGSTDNSLQILKKYEQSDDRIKVINKLNTGVSDSRNVGISNASGEYITFVDSDDWLDLEMINVMYKKAILDNSEVVMCSYVREFETHSKGKQLSLPKEVIYENEQVRDLNRKMIGPIKEELRNNDGVDALGTVWGKLYKSSIIKNNNMKFVDLKKIGSAEDSLFNITLYKHVNKVTFINEELYHYWKGNKTSLTSRYNPNLRMQWHNLFNYIKEYIIENNFGEDFFIALQNRICMSVLGLGLNECSDTNNISIKDKIKNIKKIFEDELISEAYKNFDISKFSIHWKIFYFFNKKRLLLPSFCMLNVIQFLRTRI